MTGTKTGWIFPIIILVTLIAVIWLGISQIKSKETMEAQNDTFISSPIE